MYHNKKTRKEMKLVREQHINQLLSRDYKEHKIDHRVTSWVNRQGGVTCESDDGHIDNHSYDDHANVFDNMQYEITGSRIENSAPDDLSVNTLPKNLNPVTLYDKIGEKSNLTSQGMQGTENPFGLHVLEIHPDCPIHSPSAQNRLKDLLAHKCDRAF